MKENRDRVYLERIIESIDRVDRFISGVTKTRFAHDEMVLDAVLMQLVNIGEMINHLSTKFREDHVGLPWNEAVGMRNQITHGYFEVDTKTVWKTCQTDLPELKRQIITLFGRRT